jgi:hypothetical protein
MFYMFSFLASEGVRLIYQMCFWFFIANTGRDSRWDSAAGDRRSQSGTRKNEHDSPGGLGFPKGEKRTTGSGFPHGDRRKHWESKEGHSSNGQDDLPAEPLQCAVAELLFSKTGLEFVRHDGFTLTSELVNHERVRPLMEVAVPGCAVDLGADKPLPAPVVQAVHDIVKTSILANGSPRFELWDDDFDGGWIRLIGGSSSSRSKSANDQGSQDQGMGHRRDSDRSNDQQPDGRGPESIEDRRRREPDRQWESYQGNRGEREHEPQQQAKATSIAKHAEESDDEWWRGGQEGTRSKTQPNNIEFGKSFGTSACESNNILISFLYISEPNS